MTVQELKNKLDGFDPDDIVITHGYEGGFSEIDTVKSIDVVPNYNEQWYNGEHESVDDHIGRFSEKEKQRITKMVVIS